MNRNDFLHDVWAALTNHPKLRVDTIYTKFGDIDKIRVIYLGKVGEPIETFYLTDLPPR